MAQLTARNVNEQLVGALKPGVAAIGRAMRPSLKHLRLAALPRAELVRP